MELLQINARRQSKNKARTALMMQLVIKNKSGFWIGTYFLRIFDYGQIHLLPNIDISKIQQSTCSPATFLKGGSILVLISILVLRTIHVFTCY